MAMAPSVVFRTLTSRKDLKDDDLWFESCGYILFKSLPSAGRGPGRLIPERVEDSAHVVEKIVGEAMSVTTTWVAYCTLFPDEARKLIEQVGDTRTLTRANRGWIHLTVPGSTKAELRTVLQYWGRAADFYILVVKSERSEEILRNLEGADLRAAVESSSLAIVQSGDADEGIVVTPSGQVQFWLAKLRGL